MLAGTGITTYICAVSVTVVWDVVMMVPFLRLVTLPAKEASPGLS